MEKIVSLKDDVSFKYLFLNETVRLHFISDVIGISPEKVHSVRLANTFLWRRYFREKQGILDVLIEMNNASKINIELQIRALSYWDRRSLFYLAKLFTEGLLRGEHYERLKRCICISILDFNLDDRPEYHKVYRFRDEAGYEFSDMLEIHVIELGKTVSGVGRMDEWIRLFNAQTEEELDMLRTNTKNPGIIEAIREVRTMRLGKTFRLLHDAHMKQIRDRNARDDYVRKEGRAEGIKEGRAKGLEEGLKAGHEKGLKEGHTTGLAMGEDKMNRLVLSLIQAGRQEDIEKVARDKEYRDYLYKEYGIE